MVKVVQICLAGNQIPVYFTFEQGCYAVVNQVLTGTDKVLDVFNGCLFDSPVTLSSMQH